MLQPPPASKMRKRLLIAAMALALHSTSFGGYVQIGPMTPSAPRELSPAEKAKAAEKQAREDLRKQRIDDKVKSMGEHRRAEAQRLVDMEDAARKARGQADLPITAQTATDAPNSYAPTDPKLICRQVSGDVLSSMGKGKTRAEAERGTKSFDYCAGRGGQVGVQMKCSEQGGVDIVPTVVDGKATFKRVPKAPLWTCSATYSCSKPKEVCESSEGKQPGRGVRN